MTRHSAHHSSPSRPARRELHFFPKHHRLIWSVDGRPVLQGEAWGGEMPIAGRRYDVMSPRPTTPGHYVIHSYAPYVTRTWESSRIAWGTRLMIDIAHSELLYEVGPSRWRRVRDQVPWATLGQVAALYYALFGHSRKFDFDGDHIPEVWVFNDFGPMAVRYFRDLNHNRKLDGREHLSGEMIHTTPNNEAEVATGHPVALFPSHGCIHVNPIQRDMFFRRGAFNPGTAFIIHGYREDIPAALQ